MEGNLSGGIHSCDTCKKIFRHESSFQEHEQVCSGIGTGTGMNQTTLQRSAEIASTLVYEGSVEHDIIYNPSGNFTYLNDMDIDVHMDQVEMAQGWVERQGDGGTVGMNNNPLYRPLVDKWFDIGESHKERRMTAGMMLRTIRVCSLEILISLQSVTSKTKSRRETGRLLENVVGRRRRLRRQGTSQNRNGVMVEIWRWMKTTENVPMSM